MKYLLDVNALLAAIIQNHPSHNVVDTWLEYKDLAVSPLSELGFLRISTHPKAYHFGMAVARQALDDFITKRQVDFVVDDLPALKASAVKSEEVTGTYLAELAKQHQMKLATLDQSINHTAVEIIQ